MTAYVLDASVAVAWYLPETVSPQARVWQAGLASGELELWTPSLHFVEVANVLRTYVRRRLLEPHLALEVWETHLEAPLRIADPDTASVLATALELDATAYDAVYVALARELEVPLVTAEKVTRPWVARLGDRVVTLAAEPSSRSPGA